MTQRAMSRSSLTTGRDLSELSLSIIHFVNLLKKINHLVNCEQIGQLRCILRLLQQKKGAILPFCTPSHCSCLKFITSPMCLLTNEHLPGLSDISINICHLPNFTLYVIQSVWEEFDFHLAKARLWHRPTSGCPPASGYRPVPSYQAVQSEGPACPRDHLGLEGKTLQLQPRSP